MVDLGKRIEKSINKNSKEDKNISSSRRKSQPQN
jgi:hypothetical protein